jgi:uncharacterized membrane protein
VESRDGISALSKAFAKATLLPRAALRSLRPGSPLAQSDERAPARRRATNRALLLLAIEAAAVTYLLLCASLGPSALLSFLLRNEASSVVRRLLVLVPFVVGVAVRLGAGVAARSPVAEARLTRLAALFSPLLVAWPFPALFVKGTFANNELLLVALIGGTALGVEHATAKTRTALGSHLDRVRVALRRVPSALPTLLAAGLLVGMWSFAWLGSVRIHDKMLTSGFDLGIFENVFFNTLHGRTGVGMDRSYFAEHGELLIYLLLPLYALSPRAETLLLVQATLVVGAGLPLFLLAKYWLKSGFQALAVLATFLCLPAVHGSLFYDFHFLPLSAFFLLWGAYFYARRATAPFWVAILLAMSCREDVALGLFLVGSGLFVMGRSRATAMTLAALGAGWFVLVKFVWMRRFGVEAFTEYYNALIPAGSSGFGAVLRTVLSNPLYALQRTATEDKLLLALHLFGPLAFLPLRQWRTLPLLLPGLAVVGLATNRAAVSQVHFHYAMHFVPYAMIAIVAALAARARASRGPLVLAMLVASAVASVHFGAFVGKSFRTSFHEVSFSWERKDTQRRKAFRELAARIPDDASVAAGEYEAPHLARRARLLAVKEGLGDARFVIYSTRSLRWGGQDEIKRALEGKTHGVVAIKGDLALLERGASTAKNRDGMRQLEKK